MQVIIEQAWRQAIDEELKRRKWSRSEFARHLGVTPGFVSNYLNGTNSPGPEVMERWLRSLDLEPVLTFRRVSKATA